MIEKENIISEFCIGRRSKTTANHWVDVAADFSFLGAKKSILVLPGNGTNSAETANGMCKLIEKMLPLELRDSCQVYSLYYADDNMRQTSTVLRAEKLFNDLLVPLIAYKDKDNNLQRLDAQKAARNLRNLTIVTHCYGGYIMQELDRLLDETMENLSYTPQEREFIHKQLFVAQHNNIDEDLGKTDFGSSQLIRISTKDEYVYYKDALNPSFGHYVENSNFSEDSLLYVRLSEHTRVLLADCITKDGLKEHDGGYWLENCHKTETGKKEEQIFQSIFQEIMLSDELITDFEQIVRRAIKKNRALNQIFVPVMLKGQALAKGLAAHKRFIEENYADMKAKIAQHSDIKEDIKEQYLEVIMAEDKDGMFLMDYALKYKNFKAAEQLAYRMRQGIPREAYLLHNRNQKDARNKIRQWAQKALDCGQAEAFEAIAGAFSGAIDFDYKDADADMLCAAAQVCARYTFPDDKFTQEIFCRNLAEIYAKSEKYANNPQAQKAQEIVEKIIFKHYLSGFEYSSYAREKLKTYCRQCGAQKLQRKVEKQWPPVDMIKDCVPRGILR